MSKPIPNRDDLLERLTYYVARLSERARKGDEASIKKIIEFVTSEESELNNSVVRGLEIRDVMIALVRRGVVVPLEPGLIQDQSKALSFGNVKVRLTTDTKLQTGRLYKEAENVLKEGKGYSKHATRNMTLQSLAIRIYCRIKDINYTYEYKCSIMRDLRYLREWDKKNQNSTRSFIGRLRRANAVDLWAFENKPKKKA